MDQLRSTLQALLQTLLAGGAFSGGAASPAATSAAARPPAQARKHRAIVPPETFVPQGYVAPAVYVTGVETYGTPTVPFMSTGVETSTSSSFVPAASETRHVTTTTCAQGPTYTTLEPVGVTSSMDNNGSLANLPLPPGTSPVVRSVGLKSPSTMLSTILRELNTPVHGGALADDDDGAVPVADNGSRPRSGNGHDDGNDNI